MTIQKLFEILESEIQNGNGGNQVKVACDYGDYHHTAQSLDIREVEFGAERETGYSRSGKEAVCGTRNDDILFIIARDAAEICEVEDDEEDDDGDDE